MFNWNGESSLHVDFPRCRLLLKVFANRSFACGGKERLAEKDIIRAVSANLLSCA
jgi:hypothetical protein